VEEEEGGKGKDRAGRGKFHRGEGDGRGEVRDFRILTSPLLMPMPKADAVM
jgi:hypothetical protein